MFQQAERPKEREIRARWSLPCVMICFVRICCGLLPPDSSLSRKDFFLRISQCSVLRQPPALRPVLGGYSQVSNHPTGQLAAVRGLQYRAWRLEAWVGKGGNDIHSSHDHSFQRCCFWLFCCVCPVCQCVCVCVCVCVPLSLSLSLSVCLCLSLLNVQSQWYETALTTRHRLASHSKFPPKAWADYCGVYIHCSFDQTAYYVHRYHWLSWEDQDHNVTYL